MSSIVVSGDTSGAITLAAPAVAGSNTLTLPAVTGTFLTDKTVGTVLQVVSTTLTTTFSTTTTGAFTDITGLSVSITPKFSTSKILVAFNGMLSGTVAVSGFNVRIVRDSTAVGVGTSTGSRTASTSSGYVGEANFPVSTSGSFLDSPATTSATTYKIQYFIAAGTFYCNRGQADTDSAGIPRSVSTITVMEVAA